MSRKYRCPFCNKTYERDKLSSHIDNKHEEMINPDKEYTANRIVFDVCNHKEPIGQGKGICRICKQPTEWNEDNVRYESYCSDQCKKQARENYKNNMLRVHGKITLLDDMEWQENMLANRSISGKYKWSDGTYKSYVGSYEKKFLEFCDNVLNIRSDDLLTPGPTIEYEYEGKKHKWITDAIYLPYNLVFDIKDGGDNKNTRDMPEYRNKQIQKEKFITDQGEYNYIRLTNNEFVQLLTIFAELKMMYLEDDVSNNRKTISRIHEHTGPGGIGGMGLTSPLPTLYSSGNPHVFITNYLKKNTFTDNDEESGYVISNDITSEFVLSVSKEGKIKRVKIEDIIDENTTCNVYKYKGDPCMILKELYYNYKNNVTVDSKYFPRLLTEFDDILSSDQLEFSYMLEAVDIDKMNERYHSNLATIKFQHQLLIDKNTPIFPVVDPVKYEYKKSLLREYTDLTILQGIDGEYFAFNRLTNRRTRGVSSIYEITDTMLNTIK